MDECSSTSQKTVTTARLIRELLLLKVYVCCLVLQPLRPKING
ncbi:hypothetical protein V512_000595 [Mesotoga sp. Brook.08.105.5.1]|nr:hypothetical protein V512_000595 [Mesotoga sp. Brook.08.105.5.1]RAO97246.1 hypothetical protein M388_11450 [Mesotoga sp. Brook.08.YT.4.2.5.4.]